MEGEIRRQKELLVDKEAEIRVMLREKELLHGHKLEIKMENEKLKEEIRDIKQGKE